MFKFVNRKEKDSIVLIPGWGFDHKIFSALDLPYNYFLFCGNEFTPKFEEGLKKTLRERSIEKISLFGWSQGAFLACNFACGNPAIENEVLLISAKRRYERQGLENIKKYLQKNKKDYLYKFYKECFCEKEHGCSPWFKEKLLKN